MLIFFSTLTHLWGTFTTVEGMAIEILSLLHLDLLHIYIFYYAININGYIIIIFMQKTKTGAIFFTRLNDDNF